jgi:formate hydrogenlyase transcriptional activator
MANARRSPNLPIQAFPTSPSSAQTLASEAVLDALKMMLIGASLNEVLTSITRLIEAHSEGMLCSIFLLDEDGLHLRYGVAANLPQAYRAATDGVCIGPNVGSCGAAAYLRQPVFISDMLSHPNWEGFRDVVLQSGLRAAWSTPILSQDGKLLGTFCMYYREVRQPVTDEIQLIDYASRIAAIAIERKRAEEKLRQDERDLRRTTDAIPHTIVIQDPDGTPVYANQAVLDYTGLTMEDVITSDFRARIFHPEDLERLREERRAALARGLPFEIEQRALRKDGQYRWFLIRYNPFRDEQGRLVRWYATGTDIEDRKQAEERIRNENLALREEIDRASMFEEIVGSSEALRQVLAQVSKVAPTDSTVLILGETGTGKELIARAIHKRSKRSARAFIRVNCAAIPSSLIASELFGHEKGAFTGALQRRLGRFELADGGTIFLDEIGDLPADTQNALLRVLQEREFERVGGTQTIRVNVRVIAATNRDLKAAMTTGTFRSDLFYRLNVFPVEIPPLRERREDITLLVEYFVDRYASKAGKKMRSINKKSLELLQSYPWPGNIRELQNVIERSVIVCETENLVVDENWLAREFVKTQPPGRPLSEELVARERERIEAVLAEARGRVSGPSGAAAKLGMPRSTLDSKIRSLKINKHRFKTV